MTISALQYHNHSSYDRYNMSGHYLDWRNQPSVFKEYPGINPIPLPADIKLPKTSLSDLIKGRYVNKEKNEITIEELSIVLRLTYGITAKTIHGREDFFYRSSASAGALFPTEIYIASGSVKGLDAGLYHFSVHSHGLSPIRTQDISNMIIEASGYNKRNNPLLTFCLTAIYFRSSWKYRDRAYRYHLLDTGHVIENLELTLKSLGLIFDITYDFDDGLVNRLLGLDETKEVSLAMVHVPGPDPMLNNKSDKTPDPPENICAASQVSPEEIDYPIIREIHRAGMKIIVNEDPDKQDMIKKLGVTVTSWDKILFPPSWPEIIDYPESVLNRRSRRNFIKKTMGKEYFLALVDSIIRERIFFHNGIIQTAILLNDNVEDFSQGIYLLDPTKGLISLIKKGSFAEHLAYISLSQDWLANGSVHFLFMTNLDRIDQQFGPRGYRYAMMTSGMIGERLYLTCSSIGIGCCGIGAFYDGEASKLIGLNTGSKLLYLVATGPVKGYTQI